MKRVIYDFGSNNGDDVEYYLKKADVVVAVEANPELCRIVSRRYSDAVDAKRLFVENCVLNVSCDNGFAEFYIHNESHVLSQFPAPHESKISQFTRVLLPSRRPVDIVKEYGAPYYIKIDLEHYDHVVLKHLFDENINPEYISSEYHSLEVFSVFLSNKAYNSFKLVDGSTVSKVYKRHPIRDINGVAQVYSFPEHSAGPFGEDLLSGDWLSRESFFRYLAVRGSGWKDIHASLRDSPDQHGSLGLTAILTEHAYAKFQKTISRQISLAKSVFSRNSHNKK